LPRRDQTAQPCANNRSETQAKHSLAINRTSTASKLLIRPDNRTLASRLFLICPESHCCPKMLTFPLFSSHCSLYPGTEDNRKSIVPTFPIVLSHCSLYCLHSPLLFSDIPFPKEDFLAHLIHCEENKIPQ
jgi:hypothetical protein